MALLARSPKQLRHRLYRELLQLPPSPPEGLTIKFAETADEYESAFKLLQVSYADLGLSQMDLEIRTTKYHLLPTTQVVIATLKGQVVATLTHIIDSALGLPIEDYTSIQQLRECGEIISEISSLAVDRDWRHNHGLFMYLTRFTLDHAIQNLGIDSWVIVTHPNARDFYEGLLCFEPLSEEVFSCDHVKGAAGFSQRLDLGKLKENFHKIYAGKPKSKNILDFYFNENFDSVFKKPDVSIIPFSIMESQLFENLFQKKSNTANVLSLGERQVLENSYPTSMINTQRTLQEASDTHRRIEKYRSPVFLPAMLSIGDQILPVRVINVSQKGARVVSKHPLGPFEKGLLVLTHPDRGRFSVSVSGIWLRGQYEMGLRITSSYEWEHWSEQIAKSVARHQNKSRSAS
ncbi:MAG: hypothetical protein H6626_09740 [Pseudobdellovibrionaceae bacterium]|nr:MAG: hypothetical protein H6626_09740 [Pseudobdellovibrionaceae bacterium]